MIICQCNPFSDRDVTGALRDNAGKTTVSAVYRCCSDGKLPECCSCLPAIKDMVQAHNAEATIRELVNGLAVPALEDVA